MDRIGRTERETTIQTSNDAKRKEGTNSKNGEGHAGRGAGGLVN